MNYDPPQNTADKLRILADAEFVTMRIDSKHDVRACGQKCILFHLLAFEGKVISARTLCERTGMGQATTSQTIKKFIEMGVLRARYAPLERSKTRIFEFNWRKLQEVGVPRPLVGTSGTPGAIIKRERARSILAGAAA